MDWMWIMVIASGVIGVCVLAVRGAVDSPQQCPKCGADRRVIDDELEAYRLMSMVSPPLRCPVCGEIDSRMVWASIDDPWA
ncbi:MAG: hypothetical protein GEU73_10545 [Chloroflexi bacterium]|nr:hypothetical protein [Chloroflexota bacterium]